MDEQNLVRIDKGRSAVLARRTVDAYLMEREERVIQLMISSYNSDTLTDNKLRGMVGELASLRGLAAQLEREIRQGIAAEEEEMIPHGSTAD